VSGSTEETPRVGAPRAAGRAGAGTATERYVLDREIGRGGMGRVFAGRDLRLGRPVAIKVLLEPEAAVSARFEREALLAARLQHPGIVPVYDSGFWPTGEPFLVMRLVLGRSLGRAIEEAETLGDRLALLPPVLAAVDAVAYAHDQGVVHRDLKPSNVILGAFGEAVVVDWGLAKDLRAGEPAPEGAPGGPGPPGTTQAGAVLGTPAYMAPEQAAGQTVDARADVHALGAILYHLLAGAPPEPSSSAVAPVVRAAYRPPPALAALVPQAPPDLLAVVGKAMAADPALRYPSAFELAEDLKRFQTAELVAARHYSLLSRGWRWLGRRPGVVAALIAAAAVLGAMQCLGR
jgi:serine/threonine protein kinase